MSPECEKKNLLILIDFGQLCCAWGASFAVLEKFLRVSRRIAMALRELSRSDLSIWGWGNP